MKVNIHIQRMVLDGISIPQHQQASFQAAVETEITRLFAVNGPKDSLMTGGAIAGIAGHDIRLAPEAEPEVLGRQIGRTIYEGINR